MGEDVEVILLLQAPSKFISGGAELDYTGDSLRAGNETRGERLIKDSLCAWPMEGSPLSSGFFIS